LSNAYDMVNGALINSDKAGVIKESDELFILVKEVVLVGGKISNLNVIIFQDGLKLTEDNEIVAVEKKALTTQTIKFRKFKHFVFETAAGTAHTWLEYPKFGTGTDANGKTIVTDAGTEKFTRLNLTAMFNWNYYCRNSNVIPFFQLGVGANAEYPAFFIGGGFRFGSDAKTHFAISGGFATSWVKTLHKLQLGSIVSGSSDIDKDVTYELKFPLKPYIGIQFNF